VVVVAMVVGFLVGLILVLHIYVGWWYGGGLGGWFVTIKIREKFI
jgi:hypothetical protein